MPTVPPEQPIVYVGLDGVPHRGTIISVVKGEDGRIVEHAQGIKYFDNDLAYIHTELTDLSKLIRGEEKP